MDELGRLLRNMGPASAVRTSRRRFLTLNVARLPQALSECVQERVRVRIAMARTPIV